jgi:hypothetical protein
MGASILFLALFFKFAEMNLMRDQASTKFLESTISFSLILVSGTYYVLNYEGVAQRSGLSILIIFLGITLIALGCGDISLGKKVYFTGLKGIFLIPLTSFFFFSKPNVAINLHPFESHAYANTQLLLKGAKPWKDFSLEHGLWEDLGRNLFSSLLAGSSDLQQAFGISSIVRPLEFTILGLCLFIVSKSYLFSCVALAGSYVFNLVTNYDALYLTRLIPTILLTALLKEFYTKKTNSRLALLAIVSGIQILISLEWVYSIPIVFFCVSWMIISGKNRTNQKINSILLYIIYLMVIVFTPLLLLNLTPDFIQHFLSSSGYYFAWGGSFQIGNSFFAELILVIILLALFSMSAYLFFVPFSEIYIRILQSLWLIPLFFALFAYFVKFMMWPDRDLIQPTSILLIVVLFVLANFVSVDRVTFKRNSPVFLGAFTICLIFGMASTSPYQEELRPTASTLTYDGVTTSYIQRVNQVKKTFEEYLPKGENSRILDFGNEPVTWFNILGYRTSGGISKVLNLYSSKSQRNALVDIRQNPPDAVVWGGEFGYWDWPFNGNWMKQYNISNWILDNYVPASHDGNYVLMLPKQGNLSDLMALDKVKSVQCNWLNGATNFTYSSSLIEQMEKISLSQFKSVGNSTLLSLKNKINSNVMIIATNKPTSITLVDSQGVNGQISFVTTGNFVKDTIWLNQCPGYYFDGSEERWAFSGLPEGIIVKVLN